jgi:hypothetical protein
VQREEANTVSCNPYVDCVDEATWIPAAVGLGGVVIGAVAALWGQAVEARRRVRDDAARERKLAIEEVLVRSQAIDRRGHELVLIATNLGSFTGTITRLVGSVAPVDFIQLFDRLNDEVTALERAAARVWLFADTRTVALTNAVTIAAAEMITAHHAPTAGRAWNLTRVALTGRHAVDVDRIAVSREGLATSREALIRHTRGFLKLPATDPFQTESH